MSLIESTATQHQRPAKPKQRRISTAIKRAITLMVDEGRTRVDAANACGITDDWLRIALDRPECRSLRNERLRVFRESAASRSIARVDKLADTAQSEHVKLGANELLMGIEGISKVAKSENVHVHQHVIPGLTVIRDGWTAHDGMQIDGQSREVKSASVIKRIGNSVAHPADTSSAISKAKA